MLPDAPIIVLKELAGNPLPRLNALQEALVPFLQPLTSFWISVWIMTAFTLCFIYIQAYLAHRAHKTKGRG
jgi:hypothetical protein